MNAIEKHREWIRKYHVGSSHPLLDRVYRLQEKVYIKDSPMGAVYLIHLGDTDVYKIGFSIDPERRLKQLQGKCPLPLTILFEWWGHDYESFEAGIHYWFRDKRIIGEWFKLDIKDIKWLLQTYPIEYDLDMERWKN